MSVAERYVLLGLRLGEHVEGLVDAYFGPPELKERVTGEGKVEPDVLIDEARSVRAALGEIKEAQRRAWLEAQVDGLECVAEMVAGRKVGWSESVRRCYGLDVQPTPDERFEAAHGKLDAALPGDGDLAERLEAWNTTQLVPADKVRPAFESLVAELRDETRRLIDLPEGEGIEVEIVSGEPWAAFNWYRGDLRSRVEINSDLPLRSRFLPVLAAHEVYPGHHTERVCKETRLVRELDRLEATITLVHTPECVVSEGVAEVAIEQAFGEHWLDRVAQILRPHGVDVDVETSRAVLEAFEVLGDVRVNTAYYAGEQGWTEDVAVEYHRRWMLSPEDRARKAVAFDTHPLWAPYVPTYTYGYRLVRDYVAADEGNFRRLLTEEVTTADLLDAAVPAGRRG
jgi:hypothetical protein